MTGEAFQSDQEFRLRLGSNWKSAIANAKLLISRFKHWSKAAESDLAPAMEAAPSLKMFVAELKAWT